MAFAIKKRDSYPWTVEHVIAKRKGEPQLMSFDAEFKALPQQRLDEMMKLAQVGKLNNGTLLDEVLVGWHDLTGEDGAEFTFDRTNLDKLAELYPGILGSLVRAFMDSIVGAARKN